jgi:hypothetical protein
MNGKATGLSDSSVNSLAEDIIGKVSSSRHTGCQFVDVETRQSANQSTVSF